MDVLILLLCKDSCRSIAVALLHIHFKGLSLNGLIGIGRRVIIGKLYRRNLILTLIARNHQEIIDHITFHTISCQLGLIRDFRVILIEIFREVGYWLLDKLQISNTTHNHPKGNGIIGLYLSLIELGRNVEFSNTSREISRTFR